MSEPLAMLDPAVVDELPSGPLPEWLEPMKAKLTDDRFSDEGWIYERKLDGVRLLVFTDGEGAVRLRSRNQKDLGGAYPELVDAVGDQVDVPAVLDGEVVAFDGNVTSFSRLQERMQLRDPERARQTGVAVYGYLFDLLHVDGHDLREIGLRDRKRVLRRLLPFDDPLRFTTHRNTDGESFWREACEKGWEGVIAKRADSPYRSSRSGDWLKFKCVAEQELVIGGYTDPSGERTDFGALLVGYYEGDRLRYAGKVGTGYDRSTLTQLGRMLRSRERETTPFDDEVPGAGVHWVTPQLVAQVGFTEWTADGRLRHPRHLGLRDDKDPRDVVREQPS